MSFFAYWEFLFEKLCKKEVTVSDLLLNFENDNLSVCDFEGNLLKEDSFVGTGARISLTKDGAEIDYFEVIVMGDVDGNGRIDTTDYLEEEDDEQEP